MPRKTHTDKRDSKKGRGKPAMEKRTVEERTTSGTDTDRKGVKVNVDVDKK